jgi:MSHA biogenesis protein MshO
MQARGFTLVEMIVVIMITGIIAAIVAVFLRAPVEGYLDTARRAALTDVADTALRRIARDVQAALPNSLRPNASCVAGAATSCGVELLLTVTGGRYRHDDACFSSGCSALTSLGSVIGANGEHVGRQLVIYNINNNDAHDCSPRNPSAWCGQNQAPIGASQEGGDEDVFNFATTTFSPGAGSPSRAFFIISGPVAYVCSNVGTSGGNGTGELRRYEGYAIAATPTFPPPGASGRLLARHVSACHFDYAPAVVATNGLLDLYLEITEAGETIGLHHQVHVDNAP